MSFSTVAKYSEPSPPKPSFLGERKQNYLFCLGDHVTEIYSLKDRSKLRRRSSLRGSVEMNPSRNHEVAGLIPGLAQWVKDLALLWLWCRPAAVAPIRPLAWEPPYVTSVALKSKNKTKQNKQKNNQFWTSLVAQVRSLAQNVCMPQRQPEQKVISWSWVQSHKLYWFPVSASNN